MGPAVCQMEKRGIQTNIGNLNRVIKAANFLMQSIRQMMRHLKRWIAGLKEKKAVRLESLEQANIIISAKESCEYSRECMLELYILLTVSTGRKAGFFLERRRKVASGSE